MTVTARRYLIDSNILIYPLDRGEVAKRTRAQDVLRRLVQQENAALGSQALAEFSNVALRKLEVPPDRVYRQVERYEKLFPVYPLTAAVILEAVRGVRDHQLAYYDAQIWAVAKLNQMPTVLSEDFNSGASLEGVTFLNPLEASFDLASL